ncbi:hypothetical protein C7475_101769 [Chitinophaga sp. S165]|nr:hypothetical protein C7475_101769 [Chitinophaga sp. S165]
MDVDWDQQFWLPDRSAGERDILALNLKHIDVGLSDDSERICKPFKSLYHGN